MVGKYERGKDAAQEAVEGTAVTVGRIATIITTAVADVTREIGDLIGRGFEMREAARLAKLDEQRTGSRADGAASRAPARAADVIEDPAAADERDDHGACGSEADGAEAERADVDGVDTAGARGPGDSATDGAAAAPPKPATGAAD